MEVGVGTNRSSNCRRRSMEGVIPDLMGDSAMVN